MNIVLSRSISPRTEGEDVAVAGEMSTSPVGGEVTTAAHEMGDGEEDVTDAGGDDVVNKDHETLPVKGTDTRKDDHSVEDF